MIASAAYGAMGAVFMRTMGALALLPLPYNISGLSIRGALAFSMSSFLFRLIEMPEPYGVMEFVLEFSVGFALGLPLLLLISAASGIGECMDGLRGQTLACAYDVAGAAPQSVSAALLRHYAWGIILICGGGEIIVRLLIESYTQIPCGGYKIEALEPAAIVLVNLSVLSIQNMMLCVMPYATCCLLVEFSSGLLGRMGPGLGMPGESFQLKTLISLLVVFIFSRAELSGSIQKLLWSFQRSILPG